MDSQSILKTYSPLEKTAIEIARERASDGGTWGHSSPRQYLIFCTQDESFLKWAIKNELGFKPLRGCYGGQLEISYIINWNDYKRICPFLVREKTVLLLYDYNARDVPKARLIHIATGDRTELGLFVQASERQALSMPSWTYDPMSGTYYVTTPA